VCWWAFWAIGGCVSFFVPAMVNLLHMDQQHGARHLALLFCCRPFGLGALREYWKQDQVDLRAGILCALGMLLRCLCREPARAPHAIARLKGAFRLFPHAGGVPALEKRKTQPRFRMRLRAGQVNARA